MTPTSPPPTGEPAPLCRRMVYVVGPVPEFRCGQPEDHPIHATPNKGTHPFKAADFGGRADG